MIEINNTAFNFVLLNAFSSEMFISFDECSFRVYVVKILREVNEIIFEKSSVSMM